MCEIYDPICWAYNFIDFFRYKFALKNSPQNLQNCVLIDCFLIWTINLKYQHKNWFEEFFILVILSVS